VQSDELQVDSTSGRSGLKINECNTEVHSVHWSKFTLTQVRYRGQSWVSLIKLFVYLGGSASSNQSCDIDTKNQERQVSLATAKLWDFRRLWKSNDIGKEMSLDLRHTGSVRAEYWGKPSKSWTECVDEDLRRASLTKFGKTSGRQRMTLCHNAEDREQWRELLAASMAESN